MQPFLKFLMERNEPGSIGSFERKIKQPKEQLFNWVHPNHEAEHNEVFEQLHSNREKNFMPSWVRERMTQLSNKKAWNNAILKGKVREFTHDEVKASNNADKSWNDVKNDEKKSRVLDQVVNKQPLERPIYLEHPDTGERYLISGNTRSQLAHRFGLPIEAHVIQ